MHFDPGFLKAVLSARLPNIKDKAPSKMDFPDPVSPVKVVKPCSHCKSKESIKA